jgi:hypothetical protein
MEELFPTKIRIFLLPFGILAFVIWLTVTAYKANGITGLIVGISIGSLLVIPAVAVVVAIAGGDGSNRIGSDKESVNNLITLCQAYGNRLAAGKEPPSSLADLGDFLAQEKPRIASFFSGNRFTIVWGISQASIEANIYQLMAYETQPGADGKRMVLRAYCPVELLDEQEFQAALKPIKK